MGDQGDSNQSLALKLWVVLARAHSSIAARATADVARHDLTLAEFGVLEALHHKGPLLLGELQRKVLITSGGITYVVDQLEKKGFVKRRPSPQDRRACFAALTRKGKSLMKRIFPEHERAMQEALSGLDASEQRQTTELLRALGRHAADVAGSAASSS